jgi:hypothetical protein
MCTPAIVTLASVLILVFVSVEAVSFWVTFDKIMGEQDDDC